MPIHSAKNERIKRQYFAYLREARRYSEPTVDAVAKALARFEQDTKWRDFKAFHFEQAIAFKRHLADQDSTLTGEKLSKATLNATLANLKRFFQWLSAQPGYKSGVRYPDADYFNLSEKDTRIATTRRERAFPTLDQVKRVIMLMPISSDIERRNRALVAFAILTGARDGAIASMRLKDVDLANKSVYQDARHVKTKFSKSISTFFFPVGDDIRKIVADWVAHLQGDLVWGNEEPLFPATKMALNAARQFEPMGLTREHWSSAGPIRGIFREAFEAAGLPYFNPHSLRKTLVQLGQSVCKTPEDLKAWSQNLGHESVLTTLLSYGQIATGRQGEIIRSLGNATTAPSAKVIEIATALLREMQSAESTQR